MNDENGRLRDPTKWLFSFMPLLLLTFTLIIVPSGSEAWWFSSRDLSEKPPRSATSPEIPIASSSIAASTTIAYSALTDALNKEVPATFNADGRQQVCADLNEAVQQTVQKKIGGDVGKLVGKVAKTITQVITVNQVRHVCQDVDYKVTATRTAPVTVSRSADKVHISTNVNISGQAGFSGDVARALAVDKKNFRGGVHAFADISADIDTNWCPHLQAVPGFDWTDKGQLEIVHNVWLGIEGQVGGKITEQMNAAVGRVITSIKCEDIKAAVGKVWHPYSFPISLSNESKSAIFAYLEPKSIGFSGFKYEDTFLKLALEIDAITRVMTSPLPPARLRRCHHSSGSKRLLTV